MKIAAWRIVKAKHAEEAFSGDGARKAGGRWNSSGIGVVYASSSISLAMLERLVHMDREELLEHYVHFEITFEESLVTSINRRRLPNTWQRFPAPLAVQRVGDQWVAGGVSPVLRVPSVIVPDESNYLLNPAHPDYDKIVIGPKQAIKFDVRLLKQ